MTSDPAVPVARLKTRKPALSFQALARGINHNSFSYITARDDDGIHTRTTGEGYSTSHITGLLKDKHIPQLKVKLNRGESACNNNERHEGLRMSSNSDGSQVVREAHKAKVDFSMKLRQRESGGIMRTCDFHMS